MKGKRLIAIMGPTGVGKTGLSILLAERLRTEIISADSRQIFSELEIGTAKPSAADLARVPHHFVGTRSIREEYNAGQYGREALALLHTLFQKHNTVILCGGSGLYIKAVCEGFDEMPPVPAGVREKIMEEFEKKGLSWLQKQVEEADPDYFSMVDQNNPHRLVRALALNYTTGISVASLRQKKKLEHSFEILKIGLELNREELFRRIDQRMDAMIGAGLFEEAKKFQGEKNLNALQTVGYQEIMGYLDGQYDRDEAIQLLKRNSRRYAKRQLTWFKKEKDVRWFNPDQFKEIATFASAPLIHEQ